MKAQTYTRRIAMGAALLLLAVAASSCGTLPTAPALDTGASTTRGAGVNGAVEGGGSIVTDDGTNPSGGPDVTQKPQAGEVQIPTLGGGGPNGNAWAWAGAKGKAKGHHK